MSRDARQRRLDRLARQLEPLIEANERALAGAVVFRQVRPIYPLIATALGIALLQPLWLPGGSAIPGIVSVAIGAPLVIVGLGAIAWAGPLVLLATEGAVYVARGNARRLVADAPLAALVADPGLGRVEIGGQRFWPAPGQRRSLEELVAAVEEAEGRDGGEA